MINERTFAYWLTLALNFANAKDAALEAPESYVEYEWHAPRRAVAPMRRSWRGFLRRLANEKLSRKERIAAINKGKWKTLQRWCVDRAMGRWGEPHFFLSSSDTLPFSFDDDGRPQTGYAYAIAPEALLAVVGAELIAPDPALRVKRCIRPGCGNFFMVSTVRGSGAQKHCREPVCEAARPNSTPRVRKHRKSKKSRYRR